MNQESRTTENGKIACTVGILTFNEEDVIARALDSVSEFDEVIICDGGSSDETLNIARARGCIALNQASEFKYPNNKIRNFSGVRNQMLDRATHKWFLYIDSDEYLSQEVADEIRKIVESENESAAYWIPRKYVVSEKIIECATTYPSKQMRFFHRDSVNRFIKEIHERIEVKEGAEIKSLKNFMYIPMTTDVSAIHKKWNYYIDIESERRGSITFFGWLRVCLENSKVSLLFALRHIRNFFFCRGNKMPFKLEMARHVYHWNMCKKFWGLIKLRNK